MGLAKPQYQQDEDFRVVIYRSKNADAPSQAPSQELLSEQSIQILDFCREPRQVGEIRKKLGYSDRTKFRNRYINPLLTANLLEMTMPEKPTSSQQKYRITAKGLELLARNS